MQNTDIPTRLPIPFASAAGGAFIRTLPNVSQIGVDDGAASYPDGFVPLNATPIAGGGIPPSIKDMNGALFAISGWARWVAAGGPILYDATFSTAIGGYPLGAVIQSDASPLVLFVSTVNNNVTNPNTGGAGWSTMVPVKATGAEVITGTDDAKFITPLTLASLRALVADLEAGTSVSKYVTPKSLADLRAILSDLTTGTSISKYVTPKSLADLRASTAEVLAGSDAQKYITPAAFKAALGAAGNYTNLPNGTLMQWGRVNFTSTTESVVTATLPTAFPNTGYAVSIVGMINTSNTSADTWVQLIGNSKTVSSFQVQYQRPSSSPPLLNGFEYVAMGR